MPKHLNFKPLFNLFIFTAFCLGIICGRYFIFFLLLFIFFIISLFLVYIFYKKKKFLLSDIFIIFLFFSLGGVWYISNSYLWIDKFLNKRLNLVLKVISYPNNYPYKNTFLAQIKSIDGFPTNLKINVFDYTKKLKYLNSYKLNTKIIKTKTSKRYLIFLPKDAKLIQLNLNLWDKIALNINNRLLKTLKENLDDKSYRFLASIFLGRREMLTKKEKEVFVNTGIAHLLAISGTHIGVCALFIFFLLKFFGIKFRKRLFISIIFLSLYITIIGATPPTLRALVMYVIFSINFFLKRKINFFNSFGLAGFICLLINPNWLFDVGFQLSFLSVFSLLLGFKLFKIKYTNNIFLNYLKNIFFSSSFITLITNPLISYYFGKFYILSIFYNLILIPLFTLILIINFFLILLPLNFISRLIGEVISFLVFLFYYLANLLGSIKFSYIRLNFKMPIVLIYYFILAIFFVLLRKLIFKNTTKPPRPIFTYYKVKN
ncbi:MAG: ComEC/Rec2 family competence protein [Candidatus Omnitrophica bacterium]|nr:ComEC/Rec2 family competence protein [Candidatus Omnitrophota bacterium]